MAATPITIMKAQVRSKLSEEQSRRKAEFDSSMVMIRHHVRFTESREAAEYFFREMMKECHSLASEYGLKIL